MPIGGQYAHSVTFAHLYANDFTINVKALGAPDLDAIDRGFELYPNWYCIVHQQAPTSENKGREWVHPVCENNHYLWHNGILKEETVKWLQHQYSTGVSWDTALLSYVLMERNTGILSLIEGSFACIWRDEENKFRMFRNEIAPLFVDSDLNISSTKFAGSSSLPPNMMFDMRDWQNNLSFKTANNPYEL